MCPRGRPRGQGRPRGLHLCLFLCQASKALFFYQKSPKIELFLQKNAKFSSAGSYASSPPCFRRLGALPPDLQTSPLIANFWLRACSHKRSFNSGLNLICL